jgi:hypothetical protein
MTKVEGSQAAIAEGETSQQVERDGGETPSIGEPRKNCEQHNGSADLHKQSGNIMRCRVHARLEE